MYKRLEIEGQEIKGHLVIKSCVWVGNTTASNLVLTDSSGSRKTVRSPAPGSDINVFPGGAELSGLVVDTLPAGAIEIEYALIGSAPE